jgi:hypothetical protein
LGGGREDARRPAREGAQVLHEHLDRKPFAIRAFVDAVLALSDDPEPENVERYLVASHALEDSDSTRQPRASRAADERTDMNAATSNSPLRSTSMHRSSATSRASS